MVLYLYAYIHFSSRSRGGGGGGWPEKEQRRLLWCEERMAQVSRSVPLDCKSFTFTSSSGDRVYARDLADASAHGIAGDEQMVEDFGEEQELLAESARALIAAAKAYRNENRLQKELDQFQVQRPMDDVADDSVASGDGDVHDAPQDGGDGGRNVEASDLWVDKYSPKTFSELLSSERINREVLKWVKMWDPIVFGKTSRDNAATAKSPNPKIISSQWASRRGQNYACTRCGQACRVPSARNQHERYPNRQSADAAPH